MNASIDRYILTDSTEYVHSRDREGPKASVIVIFFRIFTHSCTGELIKNKHSELMTEHEQETNGPSFRLLDIWYCIINRLPYGVHYGASNTV